MKTIAKHVCNYAVLRFQPYPETGEFVNLGVAVQCPETGLLEVLVEQRKQRRVTDFFPELDKAQFRATREAVEAEFERIKHLAVQEKDRELVRRVFQEMVRPREAVFRFGEARTILTDAPEKLSKQLFERYVLRNFAKQKEYQETVMAKRYLKVLRELRPACPFHGQFVIKGGLYHVKVPIHSAQMKDPDAAKPVPARVIKPLDFDKDDPTAIIDHGDAWMTRIRRLQDMDMNPERFIFAVNQPRRGNTGSKRCL
ncbi:MAG: DUF3037 domain-containing protein [Prosthecobacter sp.]